jgi:hypothetical protein
MRSDLMILVFGVYQKADGVNSRVAMGLVWA